MRYGASTLIRALVAVNEEAHVPSALCWDERFAIHDMGRGGHVPARSKG